ncbi:transmembrane emp24 domain-containing protein 1 isoform X1 [Pteropus alecto]|uniref:transmembrane emp24 domain-containing protein 1 isoform X1 n=1 Tax=Pteropus alecto TaxID=9402 RepID=UPI000D537FFC|nr:transmembrane emp24 domain-containing protein 1 isoform X1 [Pteropus alecto]
MMAASAALAWALWLLLPSVGVGGAGPPPIQDGEFTFLLPAGRKQCFYQSAPANASLETEYQVIGGAGLDVDFTLESPQGVLLVSESRKADGVHTVEPTEAGDYKLCFDNSFSTISEKLVFFELIFDSLQDDEEVEGWAEAVEPEEMLDVKMEDIKESIETMRIRLERSIQTLTLLRAFEARDRNLQEGNLERVNFWSAVNVAVLLLVAVLQALPSHWPLSDLLTSVPPVEDPTGAQPRLLNQVQMPPETTSPCPRCPTDSPPGPSTHCSLGWMLCSLPESSPTCHHSRLCSVP